MVALAYSTGLPQLKASVTVATVTVRVSVTKAGVSSASSATWVIRVQSRTNY